MKRFALVLGFGVAATAVGFVAYPSFKQRLLAFLDELEICLDMLEDLED